MKRTCLFKKAALFVITAIIALSLVGCQHDYEKIGDIVEKDNIDSLQVVLSGLDSRAYIYDGIAKDVIFATLLNGKKLVTDKDRIDEVVSSFGTFENTASILLSDSEGSYRQIVINKSTGEFVISNAFSSDTLSDESYVYEYASSSGEKISVKALELITY